LCSWNQCFRKYINYQKKAPDIEITQNIQSVRILVVDDEKFIRKSDFLQIKKFFKNNPTFKFEVTECCDGIDCLYKIYKGNKEGIKYDYIITDESMNFMRGTLMIKVLNTLIEENVMYKIKIFMVTSYEPWSIIKTFGNICDGIITKPLNYENLSKIFQK
jgi:CheY-like chemotaxis protein